MKKLNLGNINAGLNSLKAATDNAAQNGRFELIDTALIDFAAKNSYAADDNEESYKELAANIDEVGLLTPLGVIVNGNRYTLFSGERRFRAITTYLHWTKVPCYVFEKSSTDFLIIFSNLRKCWKGLLYQAFPAFCVSEDTPHIMAFRSLTWR